MTPAECLVCPHPAANHDETGCHPTVGMCACAVKASQLPKNQPAPTLHLEPDLPPDDEPAPAAAEPAAERTTDGTTDLPGEAPDSASAQVSDPPQVDTLEDNSADTPPADPDFEAAPPERRPETGGAAPLDRRGGTARNYDWPAIKRRYVEGIKGSGEEATVWPSLNEVADHFKVTGSRVREKAAQDGWAEQRKQWQAYMERTRQQARAAALARSGVELDNRAIDASKAGLQLLYALLVDRTQQVQLARQGAGDAIGAAAATLSALELQRIASAVDLFHKIGLRAVGDPEVTRLEITGANGRPLEIGQELRRDDPDRMATVLAVLQQAGMGDIFGGVGVDVGRGAPALERAPDGSYAPAAPR